MSRKPCQQAAPVTGYVVAFAGLTVLSLCVMSATMVWRHTEAQRAADRNVRELTASARHRIVADVRELLAGMTGCEEELGHASEDIQVQIDAMTAGLTRALADTSAGVRRSTYASSFVIIAATAFLLALSGWMAARNGQLMAASEQRYRDLIENALVGVFVYREGKFQFVNRRFAEVVGYEPQELVGQSVLKVIHPEYRRLVLERARTRKAGQEVVDTYEVRFVKRNGEAGWAEVWARAVDGEPSGTIMVNVVDITERKEALRRLQLSEQKFRTFAERLLHPLWVIQDDGIAYCNSAFALHMGLATPEDAGGVAFRQLVAPECWPDVEGKISRLLSGDAVFARKVIEFTPLLGGTQWHDVQFARIEYEGRPAVLADSQNITETKLLMEHFGAERLHDSLTGIYNRRYFNETFRCEVNEADRHGVSLTILTLDIDGFKSVNDTFGHAVGDAVLQVVADVLQRHARSGDIPIRFGGDEFLVIMPDMPALEAEAMVERLARQLVAGLREKAAEEELPEGTDELVWLSGGAASYHSASGDSLDDVLRQADERMYKQKQRNRTRRQRAVALETPPERKTA